VDPTYVYNVGKAAVGALQHFATASTSLLATDEVKQNPLELIKVYPNPAKDYLQVEVPKTIKNFNLELSDMSGRLLLNRENETKVNVSGVPDGAYLVTVKSEGKTAVRKIIIAK
jgi:aminopeptidase YwaD